MGTDGQKSATEMDGEKCARLAGLSESVVVGAAHVIAALRTKEFALAAFELRRAYRTIEHCLFVPGLVARGRGLGGRLRLEHRSSIIISIR